LPVITTGTKEDFMDYDSYSDSGLSVFYHPLLNEKDLKVDSVGFLGFRWLKILNNEPFLKE